MVLTDLLDLIVVNRSAIYFWHHDKWFLHYKSYSNSQMDLRPPQEISMKRAKSQLNSKEKFNSCVHFFMVWLCMFPLNDIFHINVRPHSKKNEKKKINVYADSKKLHNLAFTSASFEWHANTTNPWSNKHFFSNTFSAVLINKIRIFGK